MDFGTPEHLRPWLERLDRFLAEHVDPLEREFLKAPRAIWPRVQAAQEAAKRQRLWAPHLPPDHGGLGLSLSEFAHVSEVLGRSPLGHLALNCQAPDVGNMELLLLHGTQAQKARFLKPLAAGEIRSCFAMTEPEYPGSNPTWLGTTAVKDGADYVINGHKWFVTAAEGAAFAIVMAVTNPEAERPHARASQLLVPLDAPGVRLVRNLPVMGAPGAGPFSHGELLFEDCRVPQANRLGPEGAGFRLAQERLGPGRIHHCMRWIGICQRAFELTCRHAVRREMAPGRPLGTRQVIQHWIAESRAEIEAARLLVLRAAWRIDREGASAARDEISLIKFFVAGVLQRVLDRALQVHGGLGMTDETPLAFWYRHERAARIYDGADEVHKTALARRLLRRYGLEAA